MSPAEQYPDNTQDHENVGQLAERLADTAVRTLIVAPEDQPDFPGFSD